MKKDFIPRRNAALNSFEGNFLEKLGRHAVALKLRPSDIENPVKAIEANKKAFSKMNLLKANYQAACETYEATKKKSISEIRRLSRFIKASDNFTRAYGTDFGILSPQNKFDSTADLKPFLKIKVDADRVIISYTKQGTDGIVLYSKSGSETEFKRLEKIIHHTYTDIRSKSDKSKPEAREYYGIYFKKVKEVGKESDVVRVIIP